MELGVSCASIGKRHQFCVIKLSHKRTKLSLRPPCINATLFQIREGRANLVCAAAEKKGHDAHCLALDLLLNLDLVVDNDYMQVNTYPLPSAHGWSSTHGSPVEVWPC
jgi:hypothetical protein